VGPVPRRVVVVGHREIVGRIRDRGQAVERVVRVAQRHAGVTHRCAPPDGVVAEALARAVRIGHAHEPAEVVAVRGGLVLGIGARAQVSEGIVGAGGDAAVRVLLLGLAVERIVSEADYPAGLPELPLPMAQLGIPPTAMLDRTAKGCLNMALISLRVGFSQELKPSLASVKACPIGCFRRRLQKR